MYSLTPSMLTGIAQLDAEHQDLVSAINRIDAAEQRKDVDDVLVQLAGFRQELADHFLHEEEYLRLLAYPARDAHGKHHAETLVAIDRIAEEIGDSSLEPGEVATECFDELLGTVLTMDMRFLKWQAEKKGQAS